jgi:hypothetical protein
MEITSIEINRRGGGLCRTRAPRLPLRESVLNYIAVSFGGIIASEQIESCEGCNRDRANINRALSTISTSERAAIEREARQMAERIVDQGWGELSAIRPPARKCRQSDGG